ncbi:hypothetical protein Plhal304r1_c030g0098041 [Plasmopara halstedii]
MRVSIFVTGSSFCFANKLGAKPRNDSDTNERVPLDSLPHEAYAISSNALSYNVTLVDNKAHVNNKANEERMPQHVYGDVLQRLSEERPNLAAHLANELKNAIGKKKTIHEQVLLEKLLPQDCYEDLRTKLNDIKFEDITDLEIIDESLRTWLNEVLLYRTLINSKEESEVFDDKVVLDLLLEKLEAQVDKPLSETPEHQLYLRRQLVKLFDKLRDDRDLNRLVGVVLRMMVLDSTYKFLVFQEWTKNYYRPENMFTLFVGLDPTDLLHNELFYAWLNYVDWYWYYAEEKRIDRYIIFINVLQRYMKQIAIDLMLDSSSFNDAFPLNAGNDFQKEMKDAWKIKQVASYNSVQKKWRRIERIYGKSYLQRMTSCNGYFITSIPTGLFLHLTTTICMTI